jgi:hypothetical protein
LTKAFKLESSISTANMHLFDAGGCIKKYGTPNDVLDEFYGLRMAAYARRKEHLLAGLGADVDKLANRARFSMAVSRGELVINNRAKATTSWVPAKRTRVLISARPFQGPNSNTAICVTGLRCESKWTCVTCSCAVMGLFTWTCTGTSEPFSARIGACKRTSCARSGAPLTRGCTIASKDSSCPEFIL